MTEIRDAAHQLAQERWGDIFDNMKFELECLKRKQHDYKPTNKKRTCLSNGEEINVAAFTKEEELSKSQLPCFSVASNDKCPKFQSSVFVLIDTTSIS